MQWPCSLKKILGNTLNSTHSRARTCKHTHTHTRDQSVTTGPQWSKQKTRVLSFHCTKKNLWVDVPYRQSHHSFAFALHTSLKTLLFCQVNPLLPRCMECRRGIATRKLSVCLSVRTSVKRVDCDKTEERSVQILIPYEMPFSLVF